MKKIMIVFLLILLLTACSKTSYDVELQVGKDIIDINETHVDAGCILTSSDGEEIQMTVMDSTPIGDKIDNTTPGTYRIEYEETIGDETYTCVRFVIVDDLTAPTATLNKGVDTIKVGEVHKDNRIFVDDNYDNNLTITTTDLVDNTTPGSYTITYQVEDDAGNLTIIQRVVTVVESDEVNSFNVPDWFDYVSLPFGMDDITTDWPVPFDEDYPYPLENGRSQLDLYSISISPLENEIEDLTNLKIEIEGVYDESSCRMDCSIVQIEYYLFDESNNLVRRSGVYSFYNEQETFITSFIVYGVPSSFNDYTFRFNIYDAR